MCEQEASQDYLEFTFVSPKHEPVVLSLADEDTCRQEISRLTSIHNIVLTTERIYRTLCKIAMMGTAWRERLPEVHCGDYIGWKKIRIGRYRLFINSQRLEKNIEFTLLFRAHAYDES